MKNNNGKTIAICNRKGGVGKTITTISLAAGLSKKGYSVLTIDCDDSNPSLTKTLNLMQEDTITDLMLFSSCGKYKQTMNKEVIVKSKEGFDVMPGDELLAGVTDSLNVKNNDNKYFVLKNIIETLKSNYDYIIIDSAPVLNIMTLNIMAAVDEVLIVTQAQEMADAAIPELLEAIKETKKRRNPALTVSGLLITMVDNRLRSSKQTADEMATAYHSIGMNVYSSMIPRGAAGEKFASAKTSVLTYRPKSNVSIAYQNFVEEFIEGR